jgi:hypothetical protein
VITPRQIRNVGIGAVVVLVCLGLINVNDGWVDCGNTFSPINRGASKCQGMDARRAVVFIGLALSALVIIWAVMTENEHKEKNKKGHAESPTSTSVRFEASPSQLSESRADLLSGFNSEDNNAELIGQAFECADCGAEVAADSNFCQSCGTSFDSDTVECAYCDAEVPSNANFCPSCGAEFES